MSSSRNSKREESDRREQPVCGSALEAEVRREPPGRTYEDGNPDLGRVDGPDGHLHLKDLQILPQKIVMTNSDEKWHLNESCSELQSQTRKLPR